MPAATSINRWPVLAPGDARLRTAPIGTTGIRVTMRSDVLPLFIALALDYDREVAPLRRGECGAYNYREARASTAWSDHSSGTAIDLNWGHEGAQGLYGGMATMSTKQIRACAAIKHRYQIVIWGGDKAKGGDYAIPRNWDPMHFALRPGTTPADVQRVIRELNIDADGIRHPILRARVIVPATGVYADPSWRSQRVGTKVFGNPVLYTGTVRDVDGRRWLKTPAGNFVLSARTSAGR